MALASPRRRLLALVIDLAVIGFITLVTRSFALVLGVVAAIFFVRAGFKRTPVRGSVFGRAMRASVGCLGFVIAGVTAIVWSTCGPDLNAPSVATDIDDPEAVEGALARRIIETMAGAGVVMSLESVGSLEEAEGAVRELVDFGRELDLDDDQLEEMLLASIPEDAPWADEAPALVASVLAGAPSAEPSEADAVEVAAFSDAEALAAYGALVDAEPDDVVLRRRMLLARRLAPVVAADTLATLTNRVEGLEDVVDDLRGDLADTEDELREAESGGVFGWLRRFADELGFGFGWASLYMTIFLSSWKGQTVGKRVMGIRVVRLDGQPISWWVAFERAGGYAAGFATGLLGFFQVYWDANRQAIHDRIVGTVVVREGVGRVLDWESAA